VTPVALAARSVAPAPTGRSDVLASPPVALPTAPAPSQAVAAPLVTRSTTTEVAFESATLHSTRDARDRGTALSVVSTKATTPLRIAAPTLAHMASTSSTPRLAATQDANPGIAKSAGRSATSSDGAAGVDDATVQNLVQQWRPELMYCYTQYGLREHPSLVGQVIVRAALSPNGAVGHSLIESRNWNGAGGPDVENCIRSRVDAWRFPPASTGSVHQFSVQFGDSAKGKT